MNDRLDARAAREARRRARRLERGLRTAAPFLFFGAMLVVMSLAVNLIEYRPASVASVASTAGTTRVATARAAEPLALDAAELVVPSVIEGQVGLPDAFPTDARFEADLAASGRFPAP